jgi:hypothetical protein
LGTGLGLEAHCGLDDAVERSLGLPLPPVRRPHLAIALPILVGLGLVAIKLWLVSAQPLRAHADAGFDDGLFVNLARALLRGEWLGAYDRLTLARGPVYPLWIAIVHRLGLPLLAAQHLLYALSCAVTAVAAAGWWPHRLPRLALFALLLANPMTFESAHLSRVIRQGIYPALTLLVVASLVALAAPRRPGRRQLLLWAVLLGTSGAAFWLTREEGVWLLPLVLSLVLAAIVRRRADSRALRHLLAALLVAAALFSSLIAAIGFQNFRHYGSWVTVETTSSPFRDAYGALTRVRPSVELATVPVTRDVRRAIYAQSPAFAELRPYIEGSNALFWARVFEPFNGLDPKRREISGGALTWVLREAVQRAGHYSSPAAASAYYARLTREVDAACARKALDCSPPRSGFTPVWSDEHLDRLGLKLGEAIRYFFGLEGHSARSWPSTGDAEGLALFAATTREEMTSVEAGEPEREAGARIELLEGIGALFRGGALLLGLATLLAWAVTAAVAVRKRSVPPELALGVSLFGSMAALVTLAAAIEATSCPAIQPMTLAAAYPLLLFFWFTSAASVHSAIRLLKTRPSSGHR